MFQKESLPESNGSAYTVTVAQRQFRTMVNFVQPLLADALVNVMASLSLGLAGYLFWLRLQEKRERQRQQRERERNRQKHWGYV
jgi:uncharacterized protein (DUF2062 family)